MQCIIEEMLFDEVEDAPDGSAMRQVPCLFSSLAQKMWVSEAGVVRHRHVVNGDWIWGEPRPPIVDRGGRVGCYVDNRFRTLEQLVALAWIRRRTPMRRMQGVAYSSDQSALYAHNLCWKDEPFGADAGQDGNEDIEAPSSCSDCWRPLRFKMGLVPFVEAGYMVSQDGRLVASDGSVSRGSYALGSSRILFIPRVGVVPIGAVCNLLFSKHVDMHTPPPRIKTTIRLLRDGASIASVARFMAIRESTAWSYVHAALRHMSTESARRAIERVITSDGLVEQLVSLSHQTDLVLTGRLRDVVALTTRTRAGDGDWLCNPHRYSEVCAVRSLLRREYMG